MLKGFQDQGSSGEDTPKEDNPSPAKYLAPHRRIAASNTPNNPPHHQAQTSNDRTPAYTHHGRERKNQRDISTQSVNAVLDSGMSLTHNRATTHIDETTQVIMGNNGRIITVLENKRNTRFDLLRSSKALEQSLLEKAQNNNDTAMCEVAELYLSADLGSRKISEALEWLLKAANDHSNSHAMCLLSDLYASGDLGKADPLIALEWLEKAAERKNRYALAVLGQRALFQYLKIKDDPLQSNEEKQGLIYKAQSYLQQAADMGATRAMWQLAQIYENGYFEAPNLPKAISIYMKAGRLGSPASLDDLQRLFLKGEITDYELETVLKVASNIIAKTSSELAVDIGLKQIKGELGINVERGFQLLEAAAQKNNPKAIKALAKCYEKGIGCRVNLIISRRWYNRLFVLYKEAGEQHNIKALWKLAHLSLSAKLGQVDLSQAEQAMITAANTDHIPSCLHLGRLYIEGSLGNQDPKLGLPWIQKAIDLYEDLALKGDIKALKALTAIYLSKELRSKNYLAAFRILNILATQQDGPAMIRLARLNIKGKFSEKNIAEALNWVLLACDLPNETVSETARIFLDSLLYRQNWTVDEKQKILQTLLDKAYHSKAEKPFRIGRILGDIHCENILVAPDYHIAAFWYQKSGDLGNSTALLKLAKLYMTELLGSKDMSAAVDCLIKSADLANSQAKQLLISLQLKLNETNEPLEASTAEKLKTWIEKNIDSTPVVNDTVNEKEMPAPENLKQERATLETPQNEKPDPIELAKKLYQKGIEQKAIDLNMAINTLKKSSKLDNPEASFELGEIYSSGQLGEQVQPVAMLFYKRAALEKHLGAMQKLQTLYTTGTIIPTDPDKAEKWLKRLTHNLK